MDNRPIGVFDSGLGGIKILSTLKEYLPNESFIFVADEKYLPYGTKTKVQLLDRVNTICKFLVDQNCKAIVIACNTASTLYDEIKDYYNIKIFDVINPMVKMVARTTKNRNVLVLGTNFTINSKLYETKLNALDINVIPVACQDFITLVENGKQGSTDASKNVRIHLNNYKNNNFDTCVYGCTHFGYLNKEIHEAINHDFIGLDCGVPVSIELKKYLSEKDLLTSSLISTIDLYTTGDIDNFKNKVENINFAYSTLKSI